MRRRSCSATNSSSMFTKSSIALLSRAQYLSSASLRETDDKYWARLSNAMLDFVNIDEEFVAEHDRLLMGGVWAEVTLRYDGDYKFRGLTRPFFVDRLKPIQI